MTTVLMRSVDLETSRKDDGEVVEIGWTDVYFDTERKTCDIARPEAILFRPTNGFDPDAQGTHHITMARVRDLPACTVVDLAQVVEAGAPDFLVAHNAAYERTHITDEIMVAAGSDARWLCTFKSALRAWEEAPAHNLQALRYWRGLDLPEQFALPAHRAGPDSYVGAHVLAELLKTETVNDLARWTREPRYYPVCPLNKHKGWKWCDVPHSYLKWMRSAPDMEFDLRHAAQSEINRRAEQGAAR